LARTAKRLMRMRCIDTLTAVVLCAEIADFERFRPPEQPMSYLEAIHRDLSIGIGGTVP
jgi:hypothetical protein